MAAYRVLVKSRLSNNVVVEISRLSKIKALIRARQYKCLRGFYCEIVPDTLALQPKKT